MKDKVEEAFWRLKEAWENFEVVLKNNKRLRNSKGRYGKIGRPSS